MLANNKGRFSLKIQKSAKGRQPKQKTTYKNIPAYIEEKFSFKVHMAYIGEVKRDLGLPIYDAPNAAKELKRSRSHPTAKKLEARQVVLKHFR